MAFTKGNMVGESTRYGDQWQGACIVTCQSYPMKVEVHHRQPVILRYDDFASWFALEHDYTCKHTQDIDRPL